MGQLSLWEREYRMLGQDVFHAKKLIRDSGGKNEVAERRIVTLREKQVELLLTKVKELERQMEKGEQGMNIQKIQLEIGLSADLKGFLRELFGNAQKETEEDSVDEITVAPEETVPKTEEGITEKGELITKEEVSVDELRSVALAVVTTPEKEVEIQELLKEFGAIKLSDVPAERREEFLLRLKAL